MAKQETSDFLTAFAIGTVLGVGATLLLRSGKETETERIMRELRPLRKRASKQIKRARSGVADGADAAERFGSQILDTGRSVLSQFRDEVADIVSSARDEIVDAAHDTIKGARKGARRAGRSDIIESARDRLGQARKAARRQMRRR
jgi:gas vesicle protein